MSKPARSDSVFCVLHPALGRLCHGLVPFVLSLSALAGVGLFANVMAINVGIFVRAGDLFSGLEKSVDERTKELLARERELVDMLAARRRMFLFSTGCLNPRI